MATRPPSERPASGRSIGLAPPLRRTRPPRPVRVRFASDGWQTPAVCCCCGRDEPTQKYSVDEQPGASGDVLEDGDDTWTFPLCAACRRWMIADDAIVPNRGFLIPAAGAVGCLVYAIYQTTVPVYQQEGREPLMMWLAIGTAVLLGVFAVIVYGLQKNRIVHLTLRARHLKPDRMCVRQPVVYAGQRGTAHELVFANPVFADALIARNRALVVP